MTTDPASPRNHDMEILFSAIVKLQETIEENTRAVTEMRGVIIGTVDAPGVLERIRKLEGHIAKFDPVEFAAVKSWQQKANWVIGIIAGAFLLDVVTRFLQVWKAAP